MAFDLFQTYLVPILDKFIGGNKCGVVGVVGQCSVIHMGGIKLL